jgi:hypothetical protein
MTKGGASKIAMVLFWHAVDIAFYGIALKFLAAWYITPIFHTAPFRWADALGMVIVVRLLIQRHEEPPPISLQALIEEAAVPAIFTEAGYLLHHFLVV